MILLALLSMNIFYEKPDTKKLLEISDWFIIFIINSNKNHLKSFSKIQGIDLFIDFMVSVL